VNMKNKEGKDAYDLAVKYGRSDIAALLNKKSNQMSTQRAQLAHGSQIVELFVLNFFRVYYEVEK
jgi:ankyrin repeat protein